MSGAAPYESASGEAEYRMARKNKKDGRGIWYLITEGEGT
jgi:hypothetical protein